MPICSLPASLSRWLASSFSPVCGSCLVFECEFAFYREADWFFNITIYKKDSPETSSSGTVKDGSLCTSLWDLPAFALSFEASTELLNFLAATSVTCLPTKVTSWVSIHFPYCSALRPISSSGRETIFISMEIPSKSPKPEELRRVPRCTLSELVTAMRPNLD